MKLIYPSGPKSEWSKQAKKILSGEIKTSAADIPMLLNWLKDKNWPGSEEIAQHLRSFGHLLVEHIGTVLKSGDLIWIRWVLIAFAESFDASFWALLKTEIERVAFKWDPEGAHIEALHILARYGLVSTDRIKLALRAIKETPDADPEDYEKIEILPRIA